MALDLLEERSGRPGERDRGWVVEIGKWVARHGRCPMEVG